MEFMQIVTGYVLSEKVDVFFDESGKDKNQVLF
jgi:hypothetical protein